MGKITCIELHNFKSYKGTQIIDFGDASFTSVIGPNGAGKSNMMDAISFVLGIQSNHLRTLSLGDLIYREKTDSEQPQNAHVMLSYEKSKNVSIKFSRSITMTNTSSEYRINNRLVSAAKYLDVLAGENILIKAKNFLVFQGDVEAIASQSNKDLTNFIEQISGSIEYKQDYDKLKKIQEEAAGNSAASFNRKRGFNAEIKHYEVQQQQAAEFKEKLAEKDSILVQHALWKLFHLQTAVSNQNKELETATDVISKAKKHLETLEESLDDVNIEYAEANKKLNKQEKQYGKIKRELAEKRDRALPTTEKIKGIQHAIDKRRARQEILKSEVKKQKQEVERLNRDLRIVNRVLEKFEQDAMDEESALFELQLTPEDHTEYERLRSIFDARTSDEQDVMEGFVRQKSLLETKMENIQSKIDQAKAEETRQRHDIERLTHKIDSVSASIDKDNSIFKQKKKELNDIAALKQRNLRRETELNGKLQQTVSSLLEYNASRRENEKTQKLFEEVQTLKRLIPGVHGLMYELCKPKQKKFDTAVATLLGQHFNSIVVDNFSVAQECISYFKEQRLGVASFIPLESIVVKPTNGALRDLDTRCRLAIDTVDYDVIDERAVQYVCGNTLICDDLDTAKQIRWTKKIAVKCITINGAIIHKANLMTGGKSSNNNTKKWEESKIHHLTELKNRLVNELQEMSKSSHSRELQEEQLQSDIKSLEVKIDNSRTNLKSLQIMLQSREDEKSHILAVQEKTLPKLRSCREELDKYEEKIQELEQSMSGIREDIFSDFCQKVGIRNISSYEQITSRYKEKTRKTRLQYTTQIKRLESQLSFEKQRQEEAETRYSDLESDISDHEKQLKELKEQEEEFAKDISELKETLIQLETDRGHQKLDVEKKLNSSQKKREEVIENQRKIGRLIKQKVESREKLDQAEMQKLNLLRDCKLDGIEIPFLRGSMDDIPIGELTEDQTMENSDENLVQNPDFELDYTLLTPELKRNNENDIEDRLMSKVREITSELDRMVINSRASERLNDVTNKYQQVEKEFEKTRREAREAKEKFQEIKSLRSSKFSEAYEHISSAIDSIYKELTKTEAFPMGGSAFLSLDNEDEPYLDGVNYHAMPPMKRFCDMELLSGGEKTIAALALLFAINSYQPSPFFILDEIDAALDNSNIESVTKWIGKTAKEGLQFIVISLKSQLFENSDALVGIYKDGSASKALTLGLAEA